MWVIGLVCVGGGAMALSGPVRHYMRRSEGYVIVARKSVEHVTIDRPGETATVSFTLDNVTNRPVTILAAETSCDCTTLQGLPITIPARGETALRFRLTSKPAEAGRRINTNIKLLLDTPSPVVALEIAATIGEAGRPGVGSPDSAAQNH